MTMLHITLLCSFAFCAGMIDAAVGGGGLIQIPALINVLTAAPDATIFGTNKFSVGMGHLRRGPQLCRQGRHPVEPGAACRD